MPGPVFNFNLVDMQASVRQKMLKSLLNTEPDKWQLFSNDWADMELKEDADSIAVSL
jgi:hypothetical protein